jgi:hypothetical protein
MIFYIVCSVISPAAQWPEWIVNTPLLIYLAVACEMKSQLNKSDICIVVLIALAIFTGYLANISSNLIWNYIVISISFITCAAFMLIVLNNNLYFTLSEESPEPNYETLYQKQEISTSKNDLQHSNYKNQEGVIDLYIIDKAKVNAEFDNHTIRNNNNNNNSNETSRLNSLTFKTTNELQMKKRLMENRLKRRFLTRICIIGIPLFPIIWTLSAIKIIDDDMCFILMMVVSMTVKLFIATIVTNEKTIALNDINYTITMHNLDVESTEIQKFSNFKQNKFYKYKFLMPTDSLEDTKNMNNSGYNSSNSNGSKNGSIEDNMKIVSTRKYYQQDI